MLAEWLSVNLVIIFLLMIAELLLSGLGPYSTEGRPYSLSSLSWTQEITDLGLDVNHIRLLPTMLAQVLFTLMVVGNGTSYCIWSKARPKAPISLAQYQAIWLVLTMVYVIILNLKLTSFQSLVNIKSAWILLYFGLFAFTNFFLIVIWDKSRITKENIHGAIFLLLFISFVYTLLSMLVVASNLFF